MGTMTKQTAWQEATERQLLRKQTKALRKKTPLKVYSKKELLFHLEHGWKILSHNPSSYGRPQFWLLLPEIQTSEARSWGRPS